MFVWGVYVHSWSKSSLSRWAFAEKCRKERIYWAAAILLRTHLIDYLLIRNLLPLWMCCKSHFLSSSWSTSHIGIDFPRYSPRSGRFSGESSNNADVTWERWARRRSRSWGECTIFKSGLPGSLAPPCGLSVSAHDWDPPLNLCCPSLKIQPLWQIFFFTLLLAHFIECCYIITSILNPIQHLVYRPHRLCGNVRLGRLLPSWKNVESFNTTDP